MKITFRPPKSEDGLKVYHLIAACPPLDTNSSYCNLLQCSHFSSTSVIAENSAEILGFISAYRLPEHPETLFIWQVAVSESARGQGLAYQMIKDILSRKKSKPPTEHAPFTDHQFTHIETSITKDNAASWAMFESLAKQLNADIKLSLLFSEETHFEGTHPSEHLLRIGPFDSQ